MKKVTVVNSRQVIRNVKVGKNVKIWNFVNLYDCEIDDESMIGAFVEITEGVKIGKRVRVQSHSFICGGVTIKADCFIGHSVTFINDKYPRAGGGDWKLVETVLEKGASIGSGATILCGVTIGENALVGAGAVVTKDVPAGRVVVGNPAKLLRRGLKSATSNIRHGR